MKIEHEHPAPHAKYIVLRGGVLFTATPCYGMHSPWWVVKTMGGEAPPCPMLDDDEWWPKEEFSSGLAAEVEGLREVASAARHYMEVDATGEPDSIEEAHNRLLAALVKRGKEGECK